MRMIDDDDVDEFFYSIRSSFASEKMKKPVPVSQTKRFRFTPKKYGLVAVDTSCVVV